VLAGPAVAGSRFVSHDLERIEIYKKIEIYPVNNGTNTRDGTNKDVPSVTVWLSSGKRLRSARIVLGIVRTILPRVDFALRGYNSDQMLKLSDGSASHRLTNPQHVCSLLNAPKSSAATAYDPWKHVTGSPQSTLSEILIFSGRQGEFPDERVRDRLARGEGDASLGGLEPGGRNVVGMRRDGGRKQIEAALFAERSIARDDGLSDPEPRHLISDDFFGVGQRARKLSAQSHQQRSEVFGSLSYVGVVISKHGQSRLPLA